MNETFKVGEIAIYVRPGSQHYGREVEILSGLFKPISHTDVVTGEFSQKSDALAYQITDLYPEIPGVMTALPEHLRKKKPPQRDIDQIVSWDDCVWRPERVSA